MTKILCLTLPYHAYPFERALKGIAEAGYQYVAFGAPHSEVPVPNEEDPKEAARLRSLFRTYDLKPELLFAHSQFHPDIPASRAIRMLELAHELEITEVNTLGFWGYHEFPHKPLSAEEFDALNDRFIAHYQSLAGVAERLGVMITLKPHTGNTATGQILRDTLSRIGSPWVKASYDPGNIGFYEGLDPETDFLDVVSETVSIVAKEQGKRGLRNYDFAVPGEGDYDFASMFALMKKNGFDGHVIVEKLDQDGKPLEAEEIDRRAKRARENLEQLLTTAGFSIN